MIAASSSQWFKSSYSGGSGTECVECAISQDRARVRDSKDGGTVVITVGHPAWGVFLRALKTDQLAH
ncbi:DUF397 domain-containing protein [Streptomyces sp. NPDC093250]|uniref:DUF397 domain-containing protein n=1 Tax=unclassified Streptomyces TaxID=2593676 RepID=UPI003438C578